MLSIVPFRPTHFDRIEPPCEDRPPDLTRSQILAGIARGPAWSLLDDRRPVMIGGVTPVLPGVGEGWVLVDRRDIGRPILARTIARALPDLIASLRLHRLQAICRHGRPRSLRWLIWLGFDWEGLMRRYSAAGEDHHRLAIVVPSVDGPDAPKLQETPMLNDRSPWSALPVPAHGSESIMALAGGPINAASTLIDRSVRRRDAKLRRRNAEAQAAEEERKGEAAASLSRARAAKGGGAVNSGSPLIASAAAARDHDVRAENIRIGAQQQNNSFETQARAHHAKKLIEDAKRAARGAV